MRGAPPRRQETVLLLARLFARGRVTERIEILQDLGLPSPDPDVFVPLGYRAAASPGPMAPSYPPGLPLHMAAAGEAAGWDTAPFLAGPLTAIAALLLLFLARELGLSPGLSAAGVALLASCPIFFGMAVRDIGLWRLD
ncbi:MAG TPA: hypothetical protein VLU06_01550 [Thermoanaerobaculia bacterium]|nr:hypothetical protein [Thermoanaerobaculia bacterium]